MSMPKLFEFGPSRFVLCVMLEKSIISEKLQQLRVREVKIKILVLEKADLSIFIEEKCFLRNYSYKIANDFFQFTFGT